MCREDMLSGYLLPAAACNSCSFSASNFLATYETPKHETCRVNEGKKIEGIYHGREVGGSPVMALGPLLSIHHLCFDTQLLPL